MATSERQPPLSPHERHFYCQRGKQPGSCPRAGLPPSRGPTEWTSGSLSFPAHFNRLQSCLCLQQEACSHPHMIRFLSLFHVEHLLKLIFHTAASEHGPRGAQAHNFFRPSVFIVDHRGHPINRARKKLLYGSGINYVA